MSTQEPVGRGQADEAIAPPAHHQGFDRALDRALRQLTGDEGELVVVQSVVVTPNPGGVGQYKVVLVPKGG